MENAANSLKIAFAMIMLVLAITSTFVLVSKAKETSDAVFFVRDETNYYDMDSIKRGPRKVEKDIVISTLYRLYDESLVIEVKKGEHGPTSIDKIFKSDDYKSSKEAYEDISEYCQYISNLTGEFYFEEQYQEIKTSGTYEQDGSEELTLEPGGTKIYITYTYKLPS